MDTKIKTRTLHFSVEGDFITRMAREKLNYNSDIASAIKLLMGCLVSDQMTSEDRLMLALKILNGDARISGTYPDPDYGVETVNDRPVDENNAIFQIAERLLNKTQELEEQYHELINKYTDMAERFNYVAEAVGKNEQMYMSRNYASDYDTGTWLFQDILPDEERTWGGSARAESRSLYESYIERIHLNEDELPTKNFGWLEPDGTFHEVEWAEHFNFATKYCQEHFGLDDDENKMYFDRSDPKNVRYLQPDDVLLEKLGWIIIHNPGLGLPFHEMAENHRMTKAQKEFLYDFYRCRSMITEANDLYKDEEE